MSILYYLSIMWGNISEVWPVLFNNYYNYSDTSMHSTLKVNQTMSKSNMKHETNTKIKTLVMKFIFDCIIEG